MTELLLDASVAIPLLVTSHAAHVAVNPSVGDRFRRAGGAGAGASAREP